MLTQEEVIAIYEDELAKLKANGEPDVLMWACKGTRTRVSQALQTETPHPTVEHIQAIPSEIKQALPASLAKLFSNPNKETLHSLQTAHFSSIWELGDALVAEAGITESGRS